MSVVSIPAKLVTFLFVNQYIFTYLYIKVHYKYIMYTYTKKTM